MLSVGKMSLWIDSLNYQDSLNNHTQIYVIVRRAKNMLIAYLYGTTDNVYYQKHSKRNSVILLKLFISIFFPFLFLLT